MRRAHFATFLRMASSLPAGCKPYSRINYFKQIIEAYRGRDDDADKYVKKVKPLIDCSQLDHLKSEEVRIAMAKVKCHRKLDISVFYKLTGRLPNEDLGYDGYDERMLMHFYNTFYNKSMRLLGKAIRYRTNVLYRLLGKIGKKLNVDHFQFMKEQAHQQTEEEIKFVFDSLGWNYSPLCRVTGPPVPAPALASKVSLSSSTRTQPLVQRLYIWGQYINRGK